MLNYNLLSTKPSVVIVDSKEINNDRLDSMFYHSKYIKNKSNLIENKIEIRDLEDISINMNAPVGWKGIPSSSYLPNGEGVPLIRGKNIKNLLLDLDSLIGVEERIYKEQPEIQAQNNDIILTRVGTIGRVCRVPNNLEKIAMGQNLTRVELDKSIVKSEYVLAYMASKYGQLQMDRYAYGGVQPSLTNKNIKKLQIPIPSTEIQKYIGDKVRKAEKLREEAETLKEEAETILNNKLEIELLKRKNDKIEKNYSWLETSDVGSRIDSKYYSPKFLLYENTVKEKGIPIYRLEDLMSSINTGTTPKSKYLVEEKQTDKLIRVKNINESLIEHDVVLYISDDYDGNIKYAKKEDVLVSIAGTIGRAAVLEADNCAINQNVAALTLREDVEISPHYLSLYLNSEIGKALLNRESTRATVKYINNTLLKNIKVLVVDKEVQNEIEEKMIKYKNKFNKSKQLIEEAKQDVEDLIEGNLEMEN